MICFTCDVHIIILHSVPLTGQANNGSGSIELYNYIDLIKSLQNSSDSSWVRKLAYLDVRLHPSEWGFLSLLRYAKTNNWKTGYLSDDRLAYYYQFSTNATNASINYEYRVVEDGLVIFKKEILLDSGDKILQGFQLDKGRSGFKYSLDDFSYLHQYTWASGNVCTVTADTINYSKDSSLSLQNYSATASQGYVPTDYIDYVRSCFNEFYEYVNEQIPTLQNK